MADDHTCSYYCERPACVRAQRDELRQLWIGQVFTELRKYGTGGFSEDTERFIQKSSIGGKPLEITVPTNLPGGLLLVRLFPDGPGQPAQPVVTTTIGTSDKPIEVWVGTAEPPEVLPKGPSCCCTDPPTKMGLTFYMDSTVGPVMRVDAACPACGAMVKGLKL